MTALPTTRIPSAFAPPLPPLKGGIRGGGAAYGSISAPPCSTKLHLQSVGRAEADYLPGCHHCGENWWDHYAGLLGCRQGRTFYMPGLVLPL